MYTEQDTNTHKVKSVHHGKPVGSWAHHITVSGTVGGLSHCDCQEPLPGGDTPSTATTAQHSSGSSGSSGSPRRLENLEMPELPPFPGAALPAPPGLDPPSPPAALPAAPPAAPALPALSLAEALGIGNEKVNDVSSKESECDASDADATDAFVFKLTLRVADDMDLGLCFSKKGEVLRIDRVQSGAAESWNRQCSTSGSPERVLVPGDLVVSVNDQSDPEIMLQESRTRKLLKLRVLRRSGESKLKPNGVNGVNPMTSWEAVPHVQNVPHVQYPLTFPTGLGYGSPSLNGFGHCCTSFCIFSRSAKTETGMIGKIEKTIEHWFLTT